MCFDARVIYLFNLLDLEGLPEQVCTYTAPQQMQEGGGVTAAAGPFSIAERLGRVTESF